jgi:hypothetical protein
LARGQAASSTFERLRIYFVYGIIWLRFVGHTACGARLLAEQQKEKEGRTSFLKKRSKKLLCPGAPLAGMYAGDKSFLVLFFKKERSCLLTKCRAAAAWPKGNP